MLKKLFRKLVSLCIMYTRGKVAHARYLGVNVGKRSRIYISKFGTEPFLISIGDDVTITSGVNLITHDGSTWLMRDANKGRRYKFQRIIIGNKVFIGVNSIIMPGVRIEDNVIVAAGSVVTKSVPSGSVVAGVPAKIIGDYKSLEEKIMESYINDNDMDYTKNYKDRILNVVDDSMKNYLKE